jgi:hypothetical protein
MFFKAHSACVLFIGGGAKLLGAIVVIAVDNVFSTELFDIASSMNDNG